MTVTFCTDLLLHCHVLYGSGRSFPLGETLYDPTPPCPPPTISPVLQTPSPKQISSLWARIHVEPFVSVVFMSSLTELRRSEGPSPSPDDLSSTS